MTACVMVARAASSVVGWCIEPIAITKRWLAPMMPVDRCIQSLPIAAHPALFDRDRFGVEPLGDAEALRVHAPRHLPSMPVGVGLGEVVDDDVGLSGGNPPAPESIMS